MAKSFQTIGIIGRVNKPGVKETLKALISYLKELKKTILIDPETASSLDDRALPTEARQTLGKSCDLVVVVGGDGSMLNAAHALVDCEVPVLGINRGSLGFLTDIHPNELAKIKPILDGDFRLEKRFLLSASVEYEGKLLNRTCEYDKALNEFALIPDVVPHMIELEIYVDDLFVTCQRSDGIIIATPTGSTAYALSGGGPIVHPELDAMVMVPMYPHTLSARPMVLNGNQTVRIVVTPYNDGSPRLACDGQNYLNTPPNSQITIRKHTKALHLVHPRDYDYYQALRSKLHWGKKLHYTE